MLGVLVYYFLGQLEWWLVLTITILIFLIAVWSSHQAEKILFTRDPQVVTIDEVAGYLVAMFSFPNSWKWLVAGFVLFRIFDIIKPWPASYFDQISKRGFAVVMDDIIAGIYANICLQVVKLIIQ